MPQSSITVLVINFGVVELLEYKLEKRYIKRIDTSNVNLQTRELYCNYAVYIQNPRKKMYTEHGLQCNYRRCNGLGDLL